MQLKTKNATLQPIATRIKNCVLIQKKTASERFAVFLITQFTKTARVILEICIPHTNLQCFRNCSASGNLFPIFPLTILFFHTIIINNKS